MKKYISLILLFVLVCCVSVAAFAVEPETYTVVAKADVGGSVRCVLNEHTGTDLTEEYYVSESATFEAIPADGYHFTGWNNGPSTPLITVSGSAGNSVGIRATFAQHVWGAGEVTTPATCLSEGSRTFTCSCKATKIESIPKADHTWEWGSEVAPTCTEKGYITEICSVCKNTRKTETADALGHDFSTSGICSRCGAENPEAVKFLTLDKYSLSLSVGSSEYIVATVSPTTAPSLVTWAASPSGIIDVSASTQSGTGAIVSAKAEGSASLTATVSDKYGVHTAQCQVTVSKNAPKKYTVSIFVDPSNGGNPLGAGSYELNSVQNLYANPNSGFSFSGWYDSNGQFLSANQFLPITVTGNVSYTARYTQITTDTFNIVYNTNGGTFSGTYSTTYSYYSVCQLPDYKNIYRSGYQFAGWYDNANCTGYPVTYIPQFSAGNKTFYAKWIPADSVKYVTVSYSSHGTVYTGNSKVSSGAQYAVRPGESITFTFSPENLYYVYNVKVGGYNLGSRDKYTFSYESMSGNKDMYVSFGSIYGAPKTGDDSDLVLWTVLGLSAMLCSGAAIFVLKKKEG